MIYLLILIALGYYSRAQSDDLGWFYIVQQLGAKGTLQWLWQTNGGRFFSHLLIVGAAKSGWPVAIPWIIPAITLTVQWLASFIFLRTIRTDLTGHLIIKNVFFYSLLLTLLPLVVMPELSTALYWYTGAALYQWPYILTLFLLSAFLKWLRHKQIIWLWLTILILFCTGNTNEFSALFINLSFITICLILFQVKAITGRILFLFAAAALIALLINFSAPGLYVRKDIMTANKPLLSTPANWVFWMSVSAWQVIRLPISWVLAADLYTSGKFRVKRKSWWIFVGLLAISLLVLLYGTGGSVALRTLNALTIAVFILVMAGIAGSKVNQWKIPEHTRKWIYTLAIIGSPLSYQMVQTGLSAPLFAHAYDQQLLVIADPDIAFPRVKPIQFTMDRKADQRYKRQLIRQKASQLPTLLWFNEPNNEKNTLLQMIRIHGKDSLIWGEKHILNDHYAFPGFQP